MTIRRRRYPASTRDGLTRTPRLVFSVDQGPIASSQVSGLWSCAQGASPRSIRTIESWYDTKGILNGRADVTVFGMK
jgi:hypothetical protein